MPSSHVCQLSSGDLDNIPQPDADAMTPKLRHASAALQLELAQARKDLAICTSQLVASKAHNETMKNQLADAGERIATLEGQVKQKDEEIVQLRARDEVLETLYARLTQVLADRHQTVRTRWRNGIQRLIHRFVYSRNPCDPDR